MRHKDSGGSANFQNAPPLDTLVQLGTKLADKSPTAGEGGGTSTTIDAIRKRARAKYFSQNLAVRLASLPDSHLKKSYWNTFHCASDLTQKDKKLSSKYCGNRWCTVCNRIRTAKLINGYEKPLAAMTEKHFVTLTLPNVQAEDLKATFETMLGHFKQIQEVFKKRKLRGKQDWQLVGIRKLECTYNPHSQTYHPHFHALIEGKEAAEALVAEWLKRVPTATSAAQDCRPATVGAERELFKYFAKIVTKVGKDSKTLVKPLDVIFRAMWGLRVFQPIGIKKDVSEEIEELQTLEVEDIEAEEETVFWRWERCDWVNHDTGEMLTGYEPSDAMNTLVSNMDTG